MALVSTSLPPPTSLYPASAPVLSRGPADSSHLVGRSSPSAHPPSPSSFASTAPSMSAPHGAATSAVGASAGSLARTHAEQGSAPAAGGAPGAVRSIGGAPAARARTASAPRADDGAQQAMAGPPAVAADAPSLAPARAASSPPGPGGPAAVARPSPSPTANGARGSSSSSSRSAAHAPSASSSSAASFTSSSAAPAALPRLAPVNQYGSAAPSPALSHSPQTYLPGPVQQQQQHHHHNMAVASHPSFAGQTFPPFAPAYPHPAYPFIPSPHPGNLANGAPMNGYGFNGGANAMHLSAEQQKRMHQYQQQWQLEVLKGQQQQQQQNTQDRRRTSSGPAATASPSYYTTPSNYPPSPSATLHQNQHQVPFGLTGPSLPPGAMLPHVSMHGYPTPPGSTEGARSGGESGSSNSSSNNGRAEAYHPYRRDDRRGDGRSAPSSAASQQHRSAPSSASSNGSGGRRSTSHHGRQDSSASIAQLAAQQNYPHAHALPPPIRNGSSSSIHSLGASGGSSPNGSVRHVAQHSAASSSSSVHRQRTDSQNSSSSSSLQHARQDSASSGSSLGPAARPTSTLRGPSFDSARSATPVQARGRPSPLGAPIHAAEESEDDGVESDGTAEATATISTGLVAAAAAAPPPAPTSSSSSSSLAAAAKGKDKEKKGMKSRFKKAFGVTNSASSSTLTEADFDGRGPKLVDDHLRRDSSDTEGDDTPRRHAYSTHQPQQASLASSSASIMTNTDGLSTMTGATGTTASGKKPPSSRFRMLNSKFNGSSDNLSISSTVSSASVMIRKLGQMGKLASRNSLMGLTKAFKKGAKDGDDAATVDGVLVSSSSSGAKLAKKDRKKAGASTASVSHATAEFESPSKPTAAGMSPAAALARKQQQAYAEQEAAEQQRARDAAAAEAARLGPPQRSFEQVPAHARSESATSDVSSVRSGKERKKWRLGFGGGSKTDLHDSASINDDRASVMTAGNERGGGGASAFAQYDDETPRQSLEILAPPQAGYRTYGPGQYSHERSESSEYEPSLYRDGSSPNGGFVRPVRGILKGAGSYRQEDFVAPRSAFARNRASSFDSPQQHGRPGSSGGPGAALVDVIPSEQQVDGVGPSATSPRNDTHPPTSQELMHDAVAARIHPDSSSSGPYAHAELNASAPALNHFSSRSSMRPSPPATAKGRRIVFASNLSVHTTWPAAIYDRRAEPATCNRLTPQLAQQIKEELNSFKMEEMDVHPASRKLTHFFV
ncbi:hypothetical protein JCM3775_003528 [Rhodotorula graminis]